MRVTVIAFVLAVSVGGSAFAQEWVEFVSKEDGFKVDFPTQPKVTDTTATTELFRWDKSKWFY